MRKKVKKNAKQKSFFFEDYTESEIITTNDSKIKISFNRTTVLFFVFLSLVTIFCVKIIYLSLFPEKDLTSKKEKNYLIKSRGDILDRNGVILARNINIYSAGIRPKLVKDKKKFFINLKLIFPELEFSEFDKKLKNDKFFYIKKRLTEEEKTSLWL